MLPHGIQPNVDQIPFFCGQYEEIYVQEGERENMRAMLVF